VSVSFFLQDGRIDYPEIERMMKEGMETESTLMKGGGRLSECTMSRLDELYACYPGTGQRRGGLNRPPRGPEL